MIKNKSKLNNFYKKLLKKEKFTYKKALSIYESLYKEAVSLGIFNSKNILEGIETDIKIAKTLNSKPY